MKRIFIMDNDGAYDDLIALMVIASDPEVQVKGVTLAATGEADGILGAKNLADFCYYLGLKVPVAYGSEVPISENFLPFPDYIRQQANEVLKNKNLASDPAPNITSNAIKLIKNIVEQNEPVEILATGPLTNIAGFINTYPELTQKISRIFIMGGAVEVAGNVLDIQDNVVFSEAECNIAADPEAADIVFASSIPVTLIPLDATNQVPITPDFYCSLGLSNNRDHRLMHAFLKDLKDEMGEEFFSKIYFWDTMSAMLCIKPELAEYRSLSLQVDFASGKTKKYENNLARDIQVVSKILQPENFLNTLSAVIKQRLTNIMQEHRGITNSYLPLQEVYTKNQIRTLGNNTTTEIRKRKPYALLNL